MARIAPFRCVGKRFIQQRSRNAVVSADTLRQLCGLGLSLETVTQIVTLFERDASRDASRDARDTKTMSAERARRYRARKSGQFKDAEANDAASTVTENVTPDVTLPSRDGLEVSCNLKGTSEEVIGNQKEVRKKNTDGVIGRAEKVSRGTRLDQSAELSDEDRQFARDHGLKDGQIGALWVEFVDYWISIPGQRGIKLNWSATWRNRVRTVGSKGVVNGKASAGDRARDFARRIREIETAKGIGRSPEFLGGDGDRGDTARSIPEFQKLT